MIIAFPKNLNPQEQRTALIPAVAEKFIRLGLEVWASSGIGLSIHVPDSIYEKFGVKIESDTEKLFSAADVILRLDQPTENEIRLLKPQSVYASFFNPFVETELIQSLARQKVSVISMEMIPRTTKAQKMDVLSSQASLAGYAAVVLAAQKSQKIFPMQTTAAGTIAPAKVFVIGAGVAGLQAVATAKRLGARVEAFDTRPATAEQVQSLGAKFLKIDLGQTQETKDGYAKALTAEQLQKQREAMAKACAQAHVVITTAQIFGKKAPMIITKEMITQMQPGSIIVDMAVDSGGNVEGSLPNQEVVVQGVQILGFSNLASSVNIDASAMYANNLYNVIEYGYDQQAKAFRINPEDEIFKNCLLTFNGKVIFNKQI